MWFMLKPMQLFMPSKIAKDLPCILTFFLAIRNIRIKIPTTSSSELDIVKQREIADKYHKIEEIKKTVKAELKKMENIKVDIGI